MNIIACCVLHLEKSKRWHLCFQLLLSLPLQENSHPGCVEPKPCGCCPWGWGSRLNSCRVVRPLFELTIQSTVFPKETVESADCYLQTGNHAAQSQQMLERHHQHSAQWQAICVSVFSSSVKFKLKQVDVAFVSTCNKFLRHGLWQGEVVGCIVWWLGLHPAQVITIQSIAFPEEVTDRQQRPAPHERSRVYSLMRRTRRLQLQGTVVWCIC